MQYVDLKGLKKKFPRLESFSVFYAFELSCLPTFFGGRDEVTLFCAAYIPFLWVIYHNCMNVFIH